MHEVHGGSESRSKHGENRDIDVRSSPAHYHSEHESPFAATRPRTKLGTPRRKLVFNLFRSTREHLGIDVNPAQEWDRRQR